MTHRLRRPLFLTALAGLVSACAIDVSRETDDVDAVRQNADLAVAQCGQGNVASVDADGFVCKGAGGE